MNPKGFTLIKISVVVAIIGILAPIGTTAYSQDCSHIDYKKSKDEFIKCIQVEEQKKDLSYEESYEKLSNNMSFVSIDFECFNICKQSVKGTFTISELNAFCRIQCPLK